MTDLHKAAEQALEVLDEAKNYTSSPAWSPSMTEEVKFAITALREALAKPDDTGCKFPMCHNKEYQDAVAAQVMAELYTGVVVPPGYALVPVEPTREMVWACKDRFIPRIALPFFVAAYKTMIAAAPQPKDKP